MPKPIQNFSAIPVIPTNKVGNYGADDSPFVPIGSHHSGDNISAAVTLVPEPKANKLMLQATAQNIRITYDGTTPTAAIGFQIVAGDPPIVLTLDAAMIISVIEETATASFQFQWGQ